MRRGGTLTLFNHHIQYLQAHTSHLYIWIMISYWGGCRISALLLPSILSGDAVLLFEIFQISLQEAALCLWTHGVWRLVIQPAVRHGVTLQSWRKNGWIVIKAWVCLSLSVCFTSETVSMVHVHASCREDRKLKYLFRGLATFLVIDV